MHTKQRARWFRDKLKAHIRDKTLSVEARFLWLLIESYANMDGSRCHPSVETLMKQSGKSKKWVEKYIRELDKANRFRICKQKTSNGWVNRYDIRYPITATCLLEQERVGSKNDPGGRVEILPTTGYQITVVGEERPVVVQEEPDRDWLEVRS